MSKLFLIILFGFSINSRSFAVEEYQGEAENKTSAVMRAMAIGTTYGVLAGAFLGLASIAFVQKPGQNLKNIALGSSLGLYAGMMFGGYLAWSTFSEDRPSDLPTEEDYDSMDYQTYNSLPKVEERKLLSQFSFESAKSDTWGIQMPLYQIRF